MKNHKYYVTLRTPVGERYGHMSVSIENNRIEGVLDILKKASSFHGEICEDGICRISGELFTLMRTITYEGTGQIEEDSLYMTLKTPQEKFELFGNVIDTCSVTPKEDVL